MIVIDEGRIAEVIEERGPASVAINGPDGMLPQVQGAAERITERFGIPAYILADTTWGTCDLNSRGAEAVGAEILFNVGHTINRERYPPNVYLIDAYDDVPFGAVAEKAAAVLAGRRVSLLTDSQHLNRLGEVREALERGGATVLVGAGGGQLNDGQVFGCEFYPAADAAARGAEANAFMGQSSFHAAGVAMATGLPTYALDPYFCEVRDVTELARRLQKKATLAVYRAAGARTFGVIVGLKEGQIARPTALRIKRELEAEGRRALLFALTDITSERLRCLGGVDAFIQVACPRISTDNSFDVPVLSTPQAHALLRVIRGQEPGGYMERPHWL